MFMAPHVFCNDVCRDEDWQDNDGALNTISMTHPRIPIEHPSRFVVNDSECQPLQPGIWYVTSLFFTHINDLIALPTQYFIFILENNV